ncbi:hypothetical protein K32_44380 [Kaistia sp. 32K]|nr:hypothetical protein K32_44380 [Kaistia sp. 32K]
MGIEMAALTGTPLRSAKSLRAKWALSFSDWVRSGVDGHTACVIETYRIWHRPEDGQIILMINAGLPSRQAWGITPDDAFRLADALWGACEKAELEAPQSHALELPSDLEPLP